VKNTDHEGRKLGVCPIPLRLTDGVQPLTMKQGFQSFRS
jgi:hypothetical protein